VNHQRNLQHTPQNRLSDTITHVTLNNKHGES